MEKALLFVAAAQLVAADMHYFAGAGAAGGQPFDPAKPATVTQGEMGLNSNCWELLRIYYAALVQAYADPKDWPDPPVPASTGSAAGVPGSPLAGMQLAQALIAAIQSTPSVAAAITAAVPAVSSLVSTIQQATAKPAAAPAATAPATSTALPTA